MASRLDSSMELKWNGSIPYYQLEFANDVEIKGGMAALGIGDHGMEKTKHGKGSGDIELPKTKGGEAESGSKEEGSASSTTAKAPAGGRKRTKMVKHRIDKSLIPVFKQKPLPFDLSRRSEAFVAALRRYHEMERSILEQFETKGYAEYEREEEVTNDDKDEDPISV